MIFKFWRESLLALSAALLLGTWMSYRRALIMRGQAMEAARVTDSLLKANAVQITKVDTVLVEHLAKVPFVISKVDTLRQVVREHLTDTLVVKEYIEKTDSALQVCRSLTDECSTFRTLAQQRFSTYEQKIQNLQRVQSTMSCGRSNVVSASLGAVGGALGALVLRR